MDETPRPDRPDRPDRPEGPSLRHRLFGWLPEHPEQVQARPPLQSWAALGLLIAAVALMVLVFIAF